MRTLCYISIWIATFVMTGRVHAQPALANDVAALVNDVVITRLEVLQAVAPGEEVLRRQISFSS
jgi:hypothetical protein